MKRKIYPPEFIVALLATAERANIGDASLSAKVVLGLGAGGTVLTCDG